MISRVGRAPYPLAALLSGARGLVHAEAVAAGPGPPAPLGIPLLMVRFYVRARASTAVGSGACDARP